MSAVAASSLRERVRGKWQIPAVGLSLALFAAAVVRLRSVQIHYPVEAYLEQLAARVQDGYYTSAIDYGARIAQRTDLFAASGTWVGSNDRTCLRAFPPMARPELAADPISNEADARMLASRRDATAGDLRGLDAAWRSHHAYSSAVAAPRGLLDGTEA